MLPVCRVQFFNGKNQLPLREAITGSNKDVEVHSTEAIFGTSLPLAVHLFSLAHRNRERGSNGVTVSEISSLPFYLPAVEIEILHCLLSTNVGRKKRNKDKKCGLTILQRAQWGHSKAICKSGDVLCIG